MPVATGNRIQDNAVMLYISMSRLRTRRKVASSSIQSDIDASMLHVSKDILESDELKMVGIFDSAIKTWVKDRCLPSPFKGKGVLILPVRLVEQVMRKLEEAERERLPLIEAFIASYEKAKEAARPKLGSGFDERDYPRTERVREAFRFEVQLWELNTPGKLGAINKEMYERELIKMQNVWSEAQKTISSVLLEEFKKMTSHLADRLQPTADGKRKVFRDSAINNLKEWIELFQVRNLTDDAELVALVDKARAMISGVDPENVRDADHLREDLAKSFAGLTSELDSLITNRPTRAISLDEE